MTTFSTETISTLDSVASVSTDSTSHTTNIDFKNGGTISFVDPNHTFTSLSQIASTYDLHIV